MITLQLFAPFRHVRTRVEKNTQKKSNVSGCAEKEGVRSTSDEIEGIDGRRLQAQTADCGCGTR